MTPLIIQNLHMSPIPPNQFLGWDFFAVSYSKTALATFTVSINFAFDAEVAEKSLTLLVTIVLNHYHEPVKQEPFAHLGISN